MVNLGQVQYIFSDLDGTLGIDGKGIPERNKQAIKAFVKRGGKFGVCTGRAPGSAREFLQDIPVNIPCVVNGGCALYDFETGTVTQELFLPEEATDFALGYMKECPEASLLIVNREGYWRVEDKKEGFLADKYQTVPLERIAKPWYRIIFAASPRYTPRIAKEVEQRKPKGVRMEYTAPDLVEIMNVQAGKYVALKKNCEVNNISLSQVAFVGDFYNDLEVFEHVEIAACVANAPKEVKECCNLVLPECMDGAVAHLIEKLSKSW